LSQAWALGVEGRMVLVVAHFDVLGVDGKIILKWILEIIRCDCLERIVGAQDRVTWRALLNEAVSKL
jgi:hypothetical protein